MFLRQACEVLFLLLVLFQQFLKSLVAVVAEPVFPLNSRIFAIRAFQKHLGAVCVQVRRQVIRVAETLVAAFTVRAFKQLGHLVLLSVMLAVVLELELLFT